MSRLSWWFQKRQKHSQPWNQQQKMILVISWGWFRWAYALWVLKALEELWTDKKIDAIYWVSIWAIVWSLRSYGMKANKIFELLTSVSIKDFYSKEILSKSWWLVSSKKIASMFNEYLPKTFEELEIPFYAWVVDTNTAEFLILHSWDLRKIVLGSMSIPWVFPPVQYDWHCFVDGGVLNNFPVDLAKSDYPNHKVIWIALNKFKTNQKIKTAIDNLTVNFEVMMRSKTLENTKSVDYLFYRDLSIGTLSLNKKEMQEAFNLWYQDWIKMNFD